MKSTSLVGRLSVDSHSNARDRRAISLIELGIFILIIFGPIMGLLKRTLPFNDSLITLAFDIWSFGLLGFILVYRILFSNWLRLSPLTFLILLFVGFTFLTIINPHLSSIKRGIFGWRFISLSCLLHFAGFYAFKRKEQIWRMFKVFWTISAIVSIYGIYQLVNGYSANELEWIQNLSATMRIAGTGRYRIMSTTGSAVDLGFFLSLSITTLFAYFITTKSKRWPVFFLLALMVISQIFTYVRAAWVATILGLSFFVFFYFWQKNSLRLLVPVLLMSLIIFSIFFPFFATKVSNIFDDAALQERVGSLANPLEDKSMQDRFKQWNTIWNVVKQYPLGVGVGMTGASSIIFENEYSPAPKTMDNSYLKVLVETGWIGLFIYIALLALTLWRGILITKGLNGNEKVIGIMLCSSFVAFISIQFFGEYIELNPSRSFIWLFSGILMSLSHIKNNPHNVSAHAV